MSTSATQINKKMIKIFNLSSRQKFSCRLREYSEKENWDWDIVVGCNSHDALEESYLRSALRTLTNLLPSLSSFRYETWFDPRI